MPSRPTLATSCANSRCEHSMNWHDLAAAGHPCTANGCTCVLFTWDSDAVIDARDTQVGGDHYAKHAIQPWDIWETYGLNAFEGAVIKYLLRHRDKGGVEDLKKARHTLDRLIEIEEKKTSG